jgi:hypothetical protein
MTPHTKINDALVKDDEVFAAFWDFAASPYALGDILTWNMRVCVEALATGRNRLDSYVLLDPQSPSNRYQSYINTNNYHKYAADIFPAFLVNPMLRNIHFLQDRESLLTLMIHKSRQAVFPTLEKHLHGYKFSDALYSTHDKMNLFYQKHGYLPKLSVPESIRLWAKNFLKSYPPETVFVCVHMRHRSSETDMSADLFRDADFDVWLEFFKTIQRRRSEVIFITVGRPAEWPRDLYKQRNVILLKTLGYGLLEELAMIQECDLFMATNSGPAVMAVFGDKPYVIFQHPENAKISAHFWGIPKGTQRLPFGKENQIIKWNTVTVNDLIEAVEEHLPKSK